MLRFFALLVLSSLVGCNTYTRATHDYAKSVGNEWVIYEQSADARILVDNLLADKRVTLIEAQAFDSAVTPGYKAYIANDDSLSPFDLRIRERAVEDFGILIERGE